MAKDTEGEQGQASYSAETETESERVDPFNNEAVDHLNGTTAAGPLDDCVDVENRLKRIEIHELIREVVEAKLDKKLKSVGTSLAAFGALGGIAAFATLWNVVQSSAASAAKQKVAENARLQQGEFRELADEVLESVKEVATRAKDSLDDKDKQINLRLSEATGRVTDIVDGTVSKAVERVDRRVDSAMDNLRDEHRNLTEIIDRDSREIYQRLDEATIEAGEAQRRFKELSIEINSDRNDLSKLSREISNQFSEAQKLKLSLAVIEERLKQAGQTLDAKNREARNAIKDLESVSGRLNRLQGPLLEPLGFDAPLDSDRLSAGQFLKFIQTGDLSESPARAIAALDEGQYELAEYYVQLLLNGCDRLEMTELASVYDRFNTEVLSDAGYSVFEAYSRRLEFLIASIRAGSADLFTETRESIERDVLFTFDNEFERFVILIGEAALNNDASARQRAGDFPRSRLLDGLTTRGLGNLLHLGKVGGIEDGFVGEIERALIVDIEGRGDALAPLTYDRAYFYVKALTTDPVRDQASVDQLIREVFLPVRPALRPEGDPDPWDVFSAIDAAEKVGE